MGRQASRIGATSLQAATVQMRSNDRQACRRALPQVLVGVVKYIIPKSFRPLVSMLRFAYGSSFLSLLALQRMTWRVPFAFALPSGSTQSFSVKNISLGRATLRPVFSPQTEEDFAIAMKARYKKFQFVNLASEPPCAFL